MNKGGNTGGVFNPINLSLYTYTHNDPINFIDPDGKDLEGISNGIGYGENVKINMHKDLIRPKMKNINSIVLHRTVSSTASSAVNTAIKHKGRTGFHIVIDKDGSTTQIVNFENRANHVGKSKNKENASNYKSIGIEVVGQYDAKTKTWEPLTKEQIRSTAQATSVLMDEYNIGMDNIYPHEDVSWKTAGEGRVVYDAIKSELKELRENKRNGKK